MTGLVGEEPSQDVCQRAGAQWYYCAAMWGWQDLDRCDGCVHAQEARHCAVHIRYSLQKHCSVWLGNESRLYNAVAYMVLYALQLHTIKHKNRLISQRRCCRGAVEERVSAVVGH